MNTLRTRSLLLLAVAAAALPGAALAAQECKHAEPRQLAFDTTGVTSVRFEVNSHDLRLAGASGHAGALKGRACASDPALLRQLTLTQQREGDALVVRLQREGNAGLGGLFSGNSYAWLDIAGSVPDGIPVQVRVGSGDAAVSGVASLSADIGSGDLDVRRVKGLVDARIGSGDLKLQDVGALRIGSIGSGDLKGEGVAGPVTVGSVGSGDLELSRVRGNVSIASVGSGDVGLADVGGSIVIDVIGSGDVDARNVAGGLTVKTKGSGDVRHRDVRGPVNLPRR